MALSTGQLDAIAHVLSQAVPGMSPLTALRAQIKGVSIAGCEADDMRGETPYRRLPSFDVFLVNASSHCWRLVADPEQASGVVVAARR